MSEQHPSASSTLAQEDVQCDAVDAATLPTTTEVLNGMLRDAPAHRSQQQSQRIASHENEGHAISDHCSRRSDTSRFLHNQRASQSATPIREMILFAVNCADVPQRMCNILQRRKTSQAAWAVFSRARTNSQTRSPSFNVSIMLTLMMGRRRSTSQQLCATLNRSFQNAGF